MAQIHVFGRVMHDLVPKESQSKQPYVCFDLMERSGNNPPDFYQVWARGDQVARLTRLKVKKGSMIWLTGSQKLVDVRQKDGATVKKLKVWLTDFGFLPERRASQVSAGTGRVGADVFGRGGGCSGLSVRQPCGLVDRSARELSVGFGGGTGLRCIIVCSP